MSTQLRSRGADAVARVLQNAGVKRVFTLSGNHIMAVFDALLDTEIELIHTRHEAAAVHMADACARISNHMPLQEVNFFAIVIAIQAQAGGNLSEALGNLSKVLRERKKMKAKVKALSMEAKASAVIIGTLPFVVMLLVYLTSPQYMMILFADPRGHLILLGAGIWMSIGIFIMRNMVNFEI